MKSIFIEIKINVGEAAFYPGCLHKACFSSVEAILLLIYFYASGCCLVVVLFYHPPSDKLSQTHGLQFSCKMSC